MKKVLLVLFGIVGAIVLVAVVVAGYFGFIPGLSKLMGAHDAKDLGVTYTQEDYTRALEKAQVTVKDLPADSSPDESLMFKGKNDVNTAWSSEELTAMEDGCRWKYCLLRDAQVRVNEDNTAELSGVLQLDRVEGYGLAMGYSADEIATARDYIAKIFPSDPAIYIKGAPTVTDNVVDLNITSAQIGRFPVPAGYVSSGSEVLDGMVEDLFVSIPGFSINSASIQDGKLQFDGTYPATESIAPAR